MRGSSSCNVDGHRAFCDTDQPLEAARQVAAPLAETESPELWPAAVLVARHRPCWSAQATPAPGRGGEPQALQRSLLMRDRLLP